MILQIPIFWRAPRVPELHSALPTMQTPLVIDELTVFPDHITISGKRHEFDAIKNLHWSRDYQEEAGMSLGSNELIIFSFSILGVPAFEKCYKPMFFTEARRTKPNMLWSVFRYIQLRSGISRMVDYVAQVKKTNQWTIDGTTFDRSGIVIKEGKVINFKNAKYGIHSGQMILTEYIPHDGFFSKTKKVVIKTKTTIDTDCFWSLIDQYMLEKEGGAASIVASEYPIKTQSTGGGAAEALYKIQSNILVEAMLKLVGASNLALKATWKMWKNKFFETIVSVDLTEEKGWELATSILLYMGRPLPELPGFAVLFEAVPVIVSATVEASDKGTKIRITTISKERDPKEVAEYVCDCIKCYEKFYTNLIT